MNDRSGLAWQPRGMPLSRTARKGWTVTRCPGPSRSWRAGPKRRSPQAPPAAAGWQSWGQARPTDPAPGPRGGPTVGWGAELPPPPHPRGPWPLLKPAEPLAAPHSPLQSVSLPRDGLGTELCLQVQVLRDLVRHPATAAATHHSDARQGQLHLPAAPRTPGAGSQQRAPNPGALSWSAQAPGRAQRPSGRAHLGAPGAGW